MQILFRVLDWVVVFFLALMILVGLIFLNDAVAAELPPAYTSLLYAIYLVMAFAAFGIAMKWITGHIVAILLWSGFIAVKLDNASRTYGVEPPVVAVVVIFSLPLIHSLVRVAVVRPERPAQAPPQQFPYQTVASPPKGPSHRKISCNEKDQFPTIIDSDSFKQWVTALDRHLEEMRLPSRHHHFNLSSIFYGHHHNLSPEDFLKSGYSRHFDPGQESVAAPPIQEEVKELVNVTSNGIVETSGLQKEPPIQERITQLERLANLKEKGHLSQEEFEAQKRKILEGS